MSIPCLAAHPGVYQDRVILAVERLSKSFELHLLGGMQIQAIQELSFHLEEGDFGVLSGPSGTGKTTVLKCIHRSYLATGGAILYRASRGDWVDLAICSERDILELRRLEIACVTQFLRCAPRVPAEQVVASPRILQGIAPETALEEARELLKRFRVPEKLWRAYPVTFSGGEQQRVNLARAIVQKPRLLLLDEPTASLDGVAVRLFVDALREVRRGGTTCLAVFHDHGLMDELGTQIIEMHR